MKKILFILFIGLLLIFSCKDTGGQNDDDDDDTIIQKVYWGTWDAPDGAIRCADIINPAGAYVAVGGLDYMPGQIEIDFGNGKIYWLDETNGMDINRANLDGTGTEPVIGGIINDFCIDTVNNKIYVACDGNKIRDANLDGSEFGNGLEINCGETAGVASIAVDSSDGKLFWTVQSSKIYKSNINGTGIEEVYSGDVQYDIELDTVNKKIYFVPNLSINGIASINYDGSGYQVFILGTSSSPAVYAIDLINGKLYFEIFDGAAYIKYCDLDGQNINTFLQESAVSLAFEYK